MRASSAGVAREFHEREIFAISSRAFNRRFERADHLESDLLGELDDSGDRFFPQLFVLDDAALPTLPLPTSNCGLISATISARGATSASTAGITRRSEMKLVSIVTISGTCGRSLGEARRIFMRSSTVTRVSSRSLSASCP